MIGRRDVAAIQRRHRLGAELVLDARATLGEGPVWDDRAGCLWWVDILARVIHRTSAAGDDRVFAVGAMVGALALRESGGLVLAMDRGFAAFDPDTGDVADLAAVEADETTTRMNDGKVDPNGRFWAGTTAIDHRSDAGTLYRLDPDFTVTAVLPRVTISNGLDWSLDDRTMFFIDTPTRRVDAFAYDPTAGTIAHRRAAVAIPEADGSPDGMTLDADGFLWVALWDGWSVQRYRPDGRPDMRVDVPAAQVSSCAFGGPDLATLFITTAQEGFPAGGLPDQAHAGSLFAARPGPVGRPSFRFRG